jgi:hypothetical protein
MIKQIGLAILIMSLACLVLLVSYEIYCRIAEAYFRRRARDYLRAGNPIRSLQYSMKSETMWMFNYTNGSSKSMIKDLDRLKSIINQQNEVLCAIGMVFSLGHIEKTIESLQLFLGHRDNFGLDGRSVHGKPAQEWFALINALKRDRLTLRTTCKQILKSDIKSLC